MRCNSRWSVELPPRRRTTAATAMLVINLYCLFFFFFRTTTTTTEPMMNHRRDLYYFCLEETHRRPGTHTQRITQKTTRSATFKTYIIFLVFFVRCLCIYEIVVCWVFFFIRGQSVSASSFFLFSLFVTSCHSRRVFFSFFFYRPVFNLSSTNDRCSLAHISTL